MKLPEHLKCSSVISRFLYAATQAQEDLAFYKSEQERLEKEINDYEHRLELEDLNYKERAKIATALSETLQKRRTAKDAVELLTPFAEWCASTDRMHPGNSGYDTQNTLREILGRCRQKESWMEKRTYRFKALKEPDIPHKEGKA